MTPHSLFTVRAGLAALLLCAAAVTARGGDAEFYVNTYRSIGKIAPLSDRSVAMGRAGRGLADGVDSLGMNPAALGAFSGMAFDADLGLDWLDDGVDNANQVTFKVGGAVNLDRWSKNSGPNQSVGGLLHTEGYSGAAGLGMKRNQTGFLAGYGLHLMDDLLAGVSVALYDGKWEGDSGGGMSGFERAFTGGDFRLGGIYRLRDETTIGGTLGYSTGSLKDQAGYASNATGSGSLDRFSIGVGVAHQYTDETLLLGDIWYEKTNSKIPGAVKESNKAWGLSVGVEQQVLPDVMALRGGLYYDRTSYSGGDATVTFVERNSFSEGRFGFTAGVGLKLYGFDVGYSLDINSGGDVKNLFDFSTKW